VALSSISSHLPRADFVSNVDSRRVAFQRASHARH
jgi:hypothetical protein